MDGEQENRGLTEAAPLNVHYSSRKQAWETPQPFFQRLGDEFRFDIDVCATVNNTKVPKFLLIIDNPLQQTWRGTVWMNPPYGRVAWALDLEFPNRDEVAMLTGGSVAPSDLGASIVMVGLLCRSLNVLAIELQYIDIDPDTVSDKWVKELSSDADKRKMMEEIIASLESADLETLGYPVEEIWKPLHDAEGQTFNVKKPKLDRYRLRRKLIIRLRGLAQRSPAFRKILHTLRLGADVLLRE